MINGVKIYSKACYAMTIESTTISVNVVSTFPFPCLDKVDTKRSDRVKVSEIKDIQQTPFAEEH